MYQTSLSVWFVCRLCRGSFGQVDAFIEHKKEKHFTQFQNTTCIVFEERELGLMYPVVTNDGDHHLPDQSSETLLKVEVNEEDPVIPFSSEIIDEPNLSLFKLKSEPVIYESEIIPDHENNFFSSSSKQPEQNPYVLLKRPTCDEIQRACVPHHLSSLLKCEQKNFANSLEPQNALVADRNTSDHNEVDKSCEIQPTATVEHVHLERHLQFECKLCSKQLESEAHLQIHVGICALYHKDRNRFCVICNRKFCNTSRFKCHRLRFHGTEGEKMSLYKFKCPVCPNQYQKATDLRFHLGFHKETKRQLEASKLLKCSHPNCGKVFRFNSRLQKHIAAVHFGVRPFSCSFPNCNKNFSQRGSLNIHFLLHTGERPFKCTVDNCNEAFRTSHIRTIHHRRIHCNL